MVNDVIQLASQTKDNLDRSIRQILLREKLTTSNNLTPSDDVKIWKVQIKNMENDLSVSFRNSQVIITELTSLRDNCVRTMDNINIKIRKVKVNL